MRKVTVSVPIVGYAEVTIEIDPNKMGFDEVSEDYTPDDAELMEAIRDDIQSGDIDVNFSASDIVQFDVMSDLAFHLRNPNSFEVAFAMPTSLEIEL